MSKAPRKNKYIPPLRVEITGYNTVTGMMSHTEYTLEISWLGTVVLPKKNESGQIVSIPEPEQVQKFTPTKTWAVTRRFKEFEALHKQLKKRMRLPPLPPKTSPLRNKMDKAFVAQRRVLLQTFIINLIKIPHSLNSRYFAGFMGIDLALVSEFFLAQGMKEIKKPVKDAGTGTALQSGMVVEDFELLKVVGKGTFGKVMQVRKRDTAEIYAMKVLSKDTVVAKKQVLNTKTERKVLEMIDHPFIVCLRFAFQTADKLYMVMDYFEGGELFFHLNKGGRFTEECSRFFTAELVLAIACLHDHNIVYRDLKPENILLDQDGHVRLTDFGLAKETSINSSHVTHTFCGTPHYLAPEVINRGGYGKEVDWWSLGTLLYEMLTGLPPFYNVNIKKMYDQICHAELKIPASLSAPCQDILRKLLHRNPDVRLGTGSDGVKTIKEHPFFEGMDWEKLYNQDITPPYKPEIHEGKLDTSNVANCFRNMKVVDSPVKEKTQLHFNDFSFDEAASALRQDAKDESAFISMTDESAFISMTDSAAAAAKETL